MGSKARGGREHVQVAVLATRDGALPRMRSGWRSDQSEPPSDPDPIEELVRTVGESDAGNAPLRSLKPSVADAGERGGGAPRIFLAL